MWKKEAARRHLVYTFGTALVYNSPSTFHEMQLSRDTISRNQNCIIVYPSSSSKSLFCSIENSVLEYIALTIIFKLFSLRNLKMYKSDRNADYEKKGNAPRKWNATSKGKDILPGVCDNLFSSFFLLDRSVPCISFQTASSDGTSWKRASIVIVWVFVQLSKEWKIGNVCDENSASMYREHLYEA